VVPLAADMATGSYVISGDGVALRLDVRGKEIKILDRRLERAGDEIRLLWSARSRGVHRCSWSVTELDREGQEGSEVASGDVELPADGSLAVVSFSEKGVWGGITEGEIESPDRTSESPRKELGGYLLTLRDGALVPPLAVVRYWE